MIQASYVKETHSVKTFGNLFDLNCIKITFNGQHFRNNSFVIEGIIA